MKSLAYKLISEINEIYLYEKRSHPELNTVKNDVTVLEKYYQIEKNSDSEISKYYFTFQDIGKVGVNPKANYFTPAGVYTYPLKQMFSKYISGRIPYAMDRPEVYLLELTADDNRILYANDYPASVSAEADMKILKRYCEEQGFDFEDLFNKAEKYVKDSNWSSGRNIVVNPYIISHLLAKKVKGDSPSLINYWTKILHNVLGYDVIVDNGTGFIHSNEPNQACFLVPSSYKVVEKLRNNISSYINGYDFSSGKERFSKNKLDILKIEDSVYNDDIYLVNESKQVTLPKSLKVNGSLYLECDSPERNKIYISRFPSKLYVEKEMIIANVDNLKSLPENLYVGGRMTLNGTDVKKFPNKIHIGGDLRLESSKINEIPESLSRLNGGFSAYKCRFTKFPRNWVINGNLSFYQCEIDVDNLPDKLSVKGRSSFDSTYKGIFQEKYPELFK